jgi:hypothetical protein
MSGPAPATPRARALRALRRAAPLAAAVAIILTGAAPAHAACDQNDLACYAHCVGVARDIQHNYARITNVQMTLDTTASRRKQHALRHTLRVLRHQRSHLLRVQRRDCA